ncbi:MAG: hypothetical protein JWM33_887 [Caulobacteraceae bacterium]|nr:hypothetical protein [Caulobacteraceae bacterium]
MSFSSVRFAGLGMVLLLSACAKVGDLEQPKPLFGDAAKAQYEQEQAAKVEQPKKTQNFPAVPAPNP